MEIKVQGPQMPTQLLVAQRAGARKKKKKPPGGGAAARAVSARVSPEVPSPGTGGCSKCFLDPAEVTSNVTAT